MFAGGVGRIFEEFDSFLDAKHSGNLSATKKKNKKLYNLLENFMDETACLLNIDRIEYEKGKLPWGSIFYNRMLSAQTLLSVEKYNKYLACFNEYIETHGNNKKSIKKKQHYIINARNLINHLKCHQIDPDSVLVGLNPSKTICERFDEWLAKPCTHKEDSQKLLLQEQQQQPANVNQTTVVDPLILYKFGFPGKIGDIVVAKLNAKQILENDLRNRSFSSGLTAEEKDTKDLSGINIYGRVKDAVEFNKQTFINVFLAPKEERKVSLPLASVVPLRYLIPPGVSWMGNVQQMRDMVADPYDEFLGIIKHRMIENFDAMLKPHSIQVKLLHTGLQEEPVPFLYYNSLKNAAPFISSLVNCYDDSISLTMKDKELFCKLHDEFITEWEKLSKAELQKFIEEINQQDGSTNKLFMPTCEQDLMRLNRLNFKQLGNDFLKDFNNSVHRAITSLESERRELMKGTLKNQLSKWWLLLIKTRYELLLAQTSYDESAWSEDTYIDEPPRDIDGVRANLVVVQELLNTKSELHQLIVEVTEDVKKEVYPVIDDFILKAHVVLSSDILNNQISLDYNSDNFDLEYVRSVFDQKKEKIKQEQGEEIVQQYDGLMKDLKYLVEMKKLEYKTASDQKNNTAGGKLELSYAVPLSGLIMGCFFRLENILKTVLELWVPKEPKPQPQQPTSPQSPPSQPKPQPQQPPAQPPRPTPTQPNHAPLSDPSNRPTKPKRPVSQRPTFGTVSPSRNGNNAAKAMGRRPTLIGTTRPSRGSPM